MGNNVEERILDIKVRYEDAIRGIAKYQGAIDAANQTQKELKKQLKENQTSQAEYNAGMAASKQVITENKEAIRVLEKEIQNNIKAEKEQQGSLVSLRASLSNLTRQYDEMSEAERESASGEDLEIHINAITEKLKDAEEKTLRFYRNVGNYQETFEKVLAPLKKQLEDTTKAYLAMSKEERNSASGEEMRKHMQDIQDELHATAETGGQFQNELLRIVGVQGGLLGSITNSVGGLTSMSQAFTVGKAAVYAFGKQLLTLLANPIVAILAGIALVIMGIVKAINSSEDATNRVSVLLSPATKLLNLLMNVIQIGVGYILTFVEAGAKMLNWCMGIMEKLPLVGGAIRAVNDSNREAIELAQEKIAIEQRARKDEVQNAKDALEVSKYRTLAKDKEKFTSEERLKFVREANKLEEEQSKRNVELAERKLKALELESSWAENNAETNKELATLEANVFRARKEFFDKTRELKEQENTIIQEGIAAEKAKADAARNAAKEAATTAKERRDKELEVVRHAEDSLFSLLQDSVVKRRAETQLSYNREIEDLKTKLATEKNLTIRAKEAIGESIKQLEIKRQQDLKALSDEAITERITKEQKRIELMLSVVKSDSEQAYQLKMLQLIKDEEAELTIIGDGEEKKKEIRERYAGLSSAETDAARLDVLRAAMDAELATVEEGEATKLLIKQKYTAEINALTDAHNNDIIKKQQDTLRLEFETEIAQAYGNEQEILRVKMEQKLVELNSMQHLEGESIEVFNLRKLEINNSYLDARKAHADKEVEIEQVKYQAAADITNSLSSLADAASEHSRELAMASKILALAEIAINTGKAIAAGIAQAQSVPFPGNIAAIATTIATVLSNITSAISTVKSAKFAQGGSVVGIGSGTSDSIPAHLSNGESVMTAMATSMFAPILSSFNMMGGGIPINITGNTNQAIGEEMLAQAIAKGFMMAPPPILSVEEFTSVANRVKYLENLGDI